MEAGRSARDDRLRTWAADHAAELVAWIVIVAVGVGLRWWVLAGPLGDPDLDEATVGVQALAFGRGHLATFFPNQPYGGTMEPFLVSIVLKVTGQGIVALKVVPMACALAAAVLTWRAAIRLELGRAGRWCAPLLVWWGPAFAVVFSTKERGFYGVGLVLCAAYVLLVLRLDQRPLRRDLYLLGATVGLGWWQTPLTMLVAVPVVAWLVWRRPIVLRAWPRAAAFAALGALPWLVWNARHRWRSLKGGYAFETSWWQRVQGFGDKLRMVIGMETPFDGSRHLVGGRWTGVAVVVAVVAAATVRTLDRAPWLLAVAVAGYGVLYGLNGVAAGVGQDPRYAYLLVPVMALAVAALVPDGAGARVGLPKHLRSAGALLTVGAAVVALSTWGIAGMEDVARRPRADKFLASPGIREVSALLDASGRRHVITDIAGMQITYLTAGRVQAGSFSVPRYRPLELAARRAPRSTYVLHDTELANADRMRLYLAQRKIPHRAVHVGTWWMFLMDQRVLPEDVPLLFFNLAA